LVGLKPSRDRHINEKPVKRMPINIVSEGILSRSVRDTAYFHYEMEKHYHNTKLPRLPLITSPAKSRRKIGLFIDSNSGFSTDMQTRTTLLQAADRLTELGHHVEEIRYPAPASFAQDFSCYWGMLAFSVVKAGAHIFNTTIDKQ
ncbi:MAG: amidase, partial [Phototrophicales bacterium]